MGEYTEVATKHIRTNIKFFVLAAAMIASPFMAVSQPAWAVTSANNQANTLKVSPVRSDISVKPGENKTVEVTVTNLTKADITVQPYENDFIAKGEDGTPALILNDNQYAPTHSLKRFMLPLGSFAVPAGKAKAVKVIIAVPTTAQPGGYFGAIRFAPANPADGGQVNLNASVASLMLLTVEGPMTEKLNVTDYSVQQNGKSGTYFQNPNNLAFSFRFENKGSVQEAPFGNISVKNGDKVVYSHEFNSESPRGMVLPDSARRWSVPLKNIGTFGYYTVEGTLTYGSKNETVNISQSFWVIPFAVIIGGIVGLLVLIGLFVGIVVFLRGYKRRIINSQGRGGRRR
jgi:hypothetical protein